ncbi:hypothetical protein MCOR07_003865 [Pyricularia oryzae]|uniref:Uncharacterized protein n=1 Tax=Pyricularia oryzae TaxID=318829 RepID=A0A4P7NT34_PYROR|nr:hypothetical protein MCOR01_010144 [Pyricularia oryzae]KAI6272288.1 hypothetical protein MCOR26_007438 [Pyricularia oryzae]KAI6357822.1 hypothetical protein MCOR31_010141 [Pyricularia oryzae]KAI6360679.1 hypothetical protein MCOR32_008902 [Pyricularia oryzae]KAI6392201.1 hypothetical protein MCOR20_011185 [Pyricularia oryzae]
MRSYILFCCLAGLVAARSLAVQPRDDLDFTATTGPICCGHGTQDPNNLCKNAGLFAYCCSSFANNEEQGCDPVVDFHVGRDVKIVDSESQRKCVSGTRVGFVGCAN